MIAVGESLGGEEPMSMRSGGSGSDHPGIVRDVFKALQPPA